LAGECSLGHLKVGSLSLQPHIYEAKAFLITHITQP